MGIMRFALAGTALAAAAMLTVGVVDPSFAASSSAREKAKQCHGKFQALENGECVATKFINPDRVPDPCGGGACYRSSKHKRHHAVS